MRIKLLKFLKRNPSNDYGKKFTSFKDAKRFSANGGIYFDKRFTKFEGPKNVDLVDRFYVASILPSLLNIKKISILDMGGGPNPIYSYIKKSTNVSTKCYVLDTPKLVKILKHKVPKQFRSDVRYITHLSEIKLKKLDIVYFNSSMQYLENYQGLIKKISRFKPSYILIGYTPMHSSNKNYYSVQYGVPGSEHPIIFFSLKKLKKLMNNLKYKNIYENKYNNIIKNSDFNNCYYADLLFKKF
tara:strand:- start:362 stop:1087 length:726 start_codon:yes stop_codon:yes gene_type:complete